MNFRKMNWDQNVLKRLLDIQVIKEFISMEVATPPENVLRTSSVKEATFTPWWPLQ